MINSFTDFQWEIGPLSKISKGLLSVFWEMNMDTQEILQVILTSRRYGVRESYLSLYIVADIHVYYTTSKYTMSKDTISLRVIWPLTL